MTAQAAIEPMLQGRSETRLCRFENQGKTDIKLNRKFARLKKQAAATNSTATASLKANSTAKSRRDAGATRSTAKSNAPS
jgi:hypothetical protein